ncbi:MAG: membrane protein insertase YidC [bacterium]
MAFLSTLISILFYRPVFNLLIIFYRYLGSLGLAIILVALVHKVVTYSLTNKQIKSAEKNQEMQVRMTKVKDKYKHNQEQQTKELAKVQAEYMPGMIGGCLNLIISLILIIQVRNVVVNIVNQGVHAYNKVAYSESLKYKEDFVKVTLPEGFTSGDHELDYVITTKSGKTLNKKLKFAVVENTNDRKTKESELKSYYSKNAKETAKVERDANIGVYVDDFKNNHVVDSGIKELTAYLRPPLNDSIDYEKVQVKLDSADLDANSVFTQSGVSVNLGFLGADLSRVAADFDYRDIKTVWSYVLIAVSVGITQFFATKVQMGLSAKPQPKKSDKLKKKKDPDAMPDISEQMADASQKMVYFFPILTIMMSLGYMGGASIFPLGVSLFWTAQNLFVIIQQLFMNRQKVSASVKVLYQQIIKNKLSWKMKN